MLNRAERFPDGSDASSMGWIKRNNALLQLFYDRVDKYWRLKASTISPRSWSWIHNAVGAWHPIITSKRTIGMLKQVAASDKRLAHRDVQPSEARRDCLGDAFAGFAIAVGIVCFGHTGVFRRIIQ